VSSPVISSLSKVYVKSFIEGALGSETVEAAFVQAAEPDSWETATWGEVTPIGAWARVLVGPGTDFELTDGTWQMWVRVTGSAEVPVLHAGEVVIT